MTILHSECFSLNFGINCSTKNFSVSVGMVCHKLTLVAFWLYAGALIKQVVIANMLTTEQISLLDVVFIINRVSVRQSVPFSGD